MTEDKGGVGKYWRLQIAYALEFAVWGAWSYMLGTWGNARHIASGTLYAAFAFGALFMPLIGPIASRWVSAQKIFAFTQVVCGLAFLACARFASAEGAHAEHMFAQSGALSNPSLAWMATMFVAGCFFFFSIPLLNVIVFKHVPNSTKSPFVFVFGTLGWIVVNWVLSLMGTFGVERFFVVDGALAFVLAIYALTLPNTPPSGSKNGDPFGLKALALFKRWDFAVFMICATMVGIFGTNYYFAFVGRCFPDKGVWNQYSELIFMVALAFAAAKIGLKWVLTLGMLTWGVRYLCFASGNDPLAAAGILLHGLAFAFLYIAAYMYGDKIASNEHKASVQALIAFLLLGVAQTLSGFVIPPIPKTLQAQAEPQTSVVLVESACAQDASIDETAASVVKRSF